MRLLPLVIATTLAFAVTTPALATEESQSGFHTTAHWTLALFG